MNAKALQESATERHLKLQRDIHFTIEFLTRFGGSDLHFNQYRDTILNLDGIERGIRISDNAHEMISYENTKLKELKND